MKFSRINNKNIRVRNLDNKKKLFFLFSSNFFN